MITGRIHYQRLLLGMSTPKRRGESNCFEPHRSATSQWELLCVLEMKTVVSMSITDGNPDNPMLVSVPFCLATSVQPYRSQTEVGISPRNTGELALEKGMFGVS